MKYLTLNKLLFLVLTTAVLFSSCFLFPEQEEDTIYGDFKNYPTGLENDNGTLKIINASGSTALLFVDSVSPGNYIGTVGSSSSIKVRLPEEKRYTIVAVDKARYEEKGEQAFQFSCITFYSNVQGISITVKAGSTFGEGQWIINNNSGYWVALEDVDGSGTVFAVAAPNAKRVTVPVEFEKSYEFIPHFYKELKQNGKVVEVAEFNDESQRNIVYFDKNTPIIHTTIEDPIEPPPASENIKPAVFITNSSDKSVRIFIGPNDQLGVDVDFSLNSGRTQFFSGLEPGTNVNTINFEALGVRFYVSQDMTMQNNKIYRIVLSGKKFPDCSTTVDEEDVVLDEE
jgi:hypothetical protein